MPTAQQRAERARRARANGAKSRGPKTAAGLHRARTAGIKSGLYTTTVSGICPESNAAFLPFHTRLLADWHPKTSQAELLVNQLITVLWDIQLLHNGFIIYMSELVDTIAATSPRTSDPAKLILEAQKLAMKTHGGTADRFHARLGACNRTRHRLEGEVLRLEKQYATSAPSQKSLKTNGQPDAATTPPDNAGGNRPEKARPTSAPSQKGLKTNDQSNHENVQHQAAPAATLPDNAGGNRTEKARPTSAPSQKGLKTNGQPNAANVQHHAAPAATPPDNAGGNRTEKARPTSEPSQKGLKTNGQPNPENVQHHAAPAATLPDNAGGNRPETARPTSEPSQKSLKTKAKPFAALGQ